MVVGKMFEKAKTMCKSSKSSQEELQKRKRELEIKLAKENKKAIKFIQAGNFNASQVCVEKGRRLKKALILSTPLILKLDLHLLHSSTHVNDTPFI